MFGKKQSGGGKSGVSGPVKPGPSVPQNGQAPPPRPTGPVPQSGNIAGHKPPPVHY